jgi:hypothetical protein
MLIGLDAVQLSTHSSVLHEHYALASSVLVLAQPAEAVLLSVGISWCCDYNGSPLHS